MGKRILLFIATIFSSFYLYAQQADPIVFTINGEPVYKSEVEAVFKKGNNQQSVETKESVVDFVRSYAYFKQNVAEAKAQHLDTTARYIREYSSLRDEMIVPFLNDPDYNEEYIAKIYQRLLENVEINHILIPFNDQRVVLPSDTLSAYSRALAAREELLKNGFKKDENTTRTSIVVDGESVNGYMGWIVPFMLSPEVEDVVYSLPLNDISMPVRTAKGYHIIQVLAKRPAVGTVEVEQVMFGFSNIPASKLQINSVRAVAEREYKLAKEKNNFQSLCDEFAAAHNMGEKGCYFGPVSIDSKLPPAFTMAALGLKNPGDISEPVLSDYGFHIIRLVKKVPIPSYEKMRGELLQQILASNRANNITGERSNRLFSKFTVSINEDAFKQLLDITEHETPNNPEFLTYIKNKDDILLDIEGERAYTVGEFARYIEMKQREAYQDPNELLMSRTITISPYSLSSDILKDYFIEFRTLLVSDYAKSTLEKRSPAFHQMMVNVSEELLSFDVQNINIWQKAKKDDAGLAAYFKANKSKYKFTEPKYKGTVIYAKNEDILKQVEEISREVSNRDAFISRVRDTFNKKSIEVFLEPGTWMKGDNKFVDNKIYSSPEKPSRSGYPFFFVAGRFISAPEDYVDVKNEVEADYQKKLEKDWKTYLDKKYKVEINKPVLETIK
ncbi:MAG: peptidylprolyl isomerase [Dysgonomonas sp.]|nr:peptidylprolyl isomerase [Dysgonomonas sp.]